MFEYVSLWGTLLIQTTAKPLGKDRNHGDFSGIFLKAKSEQGTVSPGVSRAAFAVGIGRDPEQGWLWI